MLISLPRPRRRAWGLAAAGVLGLAAAHAVAARAAPGHDWQYPFCGGQPPITSVYDHEYPTYGCTPNGNSSCNGDNGVIRLYTNDTAGGRWGYEGHNGWDYATRTRGVNTKRPVLAAQDGTVTYAGWSYPGGNGECASQVADHELGYGLVIRVRHGGEESLYGHLSALLVQEGDAVRKGQQIGTTGTTGNSTGPHLHYGAFRPAGPDMSHSFDPYGWNQDWRGQQDKPLPNAQDPWFVYSGLASLRRILPGAPDNAACPSACGLEYTVDDGDPGFSLGCASSSTCPYWFAASEGYGGDLHYTYPNGSSADYWARWTAPLPAGGYEVEAYVPASRRYGTAHAARYRILGHDVVVDQHEEGDVWVKLGIYAFPGAPSVDLVDAVFIPGNYSYSGSCRTVAADAVRFTPICGLGGGAGADPTPSTPEGEL